MNSSLRRILSRIEYFNSDSNFFHESEKRRLKIFEIISFHQGRRSFITLITGKKDVVTTMNYTDHTKVSTVEKYITSSEQNIKEFFSWFN